MRLLLPVPGRLSASDFVAPLPSQEGCEALEARLKQVEEQGVKQEVKCGGPELLLISSYILFLLFLFTYNLE